MTNDNYTDSSIANGESKDALIAIANDENECVNKRAEAIMALGDLQIVNPLISLLENTNMEIQSWAIYALRNIHNEAIIEPLMTLLKYDDYDFQTGIGMALSQFDVAQLQSLKDALKNPVPQVRVSAIKALGRLGQLWGVEALKAGMVDKDDRVRAAAAETAGRSKAKETFAALLNLLEDEDRVVRASASEALREIGEQW